MATIRKKDSESGGGQPIIPPNTGGGGVGVDPVIPPTTAAPGNPFVPRPPAQPGQFTFAPPSYQPFQQATGYGYDDWLAQMRDAFSMPSRGAGIFGNNGGNNLPRYAFGNRGEPTQPHFGNGGQSVYSFLAPYLSKMGGGAAPPAGGGLLGGGGPAQGGPGGARGLLGNSDMQAYAQELMARQAQAGGRTR